MKKKTLLLIILLTATMTACSLKPGNTSSSEESSLSASQESTTPGTPLEETVPESVAEEDIIQGDPIIGIVTEYTENTITISDGSDPDLIYRFSTENAQVIEGDSPIAAGDEVQITYQGTIGDEDRLSTAIEVIPTSVLYGGGPK